MTSGTFAPLRHKTFCYYWCACLLSYIGTWMHIVAAGWLMASLTSCSTLIALLQTAMTLPVFFFSIPGGMLADSSDLKKFLCITQAWMGVSAIGLSVMVGFGFITPLWLLSITFILGIGAALNMPALAAAITNMVPEEDLRGAITLNGISYNTARLLGPAIGGALIVWKGPSPVFLIDALSFLFVIVFFLTQYKKPQQVQPSKLNFKKSLAGFGTILKHQQFKNILKRTFFFFFCSSIVWSLAPIIAQFQLGKSVDFYVHFIMCLGLGAVIGGFCLASLRSYFSKEQLTFGSFFLSAFMLSLIVLTKNHFIIYGALTLIGFSWISTASTFVAMTLEAFPQELKSRAFALYWVIFNGSIALGSALWGEIARLSNFRVALFACSALALACSFVTLFWKIETKKLFSNSLRLMKSQELSV